MVDKVPREKIEWFPSINYAKCTGCKKCYNYCSHKVYSWDEKKKRPVVAKPYECIVGCSNCTINVCKSGALRHPTLKQLKEMMETAKKPCCEGKGGCKW
ncbi:MAG: 4Fe-4S binding protein [Elusimicrobiota bacterium]